MRRSRAGLSLLEMLVSLALMAVIAAGLAVSLNLGVRAYDRIGEGSKLQPELALRAKLRGWVAATAAPDRLTNIPLDINASSTSFSFVTFTETQFAPDAAALRVTVTLADKIYLSADTLDDAGAVIEGFGGVLAKDVTNAHITYFDLSTDPPRWVDSWSNSASLPVLVRITADPGSQPEWPEMTVRLQHAVLPMP